MRNIDLATISDSLSDRPQLRTWLTVAAFSVAYYLALQGGSLAFLSFNQVSVFWPASGVYYAPFFMCRIRHWPLFLAAGTSVEFFYNVTSQDFPLWASFAFALNSGLEPVLGGLVAVALSRARSHGAAVLGAFFVICAAVVAPAPSAFLGIALLTELGLVKDYWLALQNWWLGDTIGIIFMAPLIIAWRMRTARPTVLELQTLPLEKTLIVVLTAGLAAWIFARDANGGSILDQPYALFPLLVWAAVRHHPRFVMTMTPVLAVFIIWCTSNKLGPFPDFDVKDPLPVQRIQEFLGLMALTTMLLTTVTWERRRVSLRIIQLDQEFRRVARANDAGQMVTTITGEIGRPIGAVIGSLRKARQGLGQMNKSGRKKAEDALVRAAEQADRASTVLHNLRAVLGRRAIEPRPTTLATVVRATVSHSRSLGRLREVDLDVDLDDSLPNVLIDPAQLGQVLSNLLGNAVDAILRDREKGWIGLRARAAEDNVQVIISDDGPGISDAARKQILEPLTSQKPGAAGVGLALSRSIMEAQNGRLEIGQSQRGGAEITLTLPVATSPGGVSDV